MDDQAILCESLRLLSELAYCDNDMGYSSILSNKDDCTGHSHAEIRILDTIAVSLTTGKPGDAVVVALDKSRGLQLVLAKNDVPTLEDKRALQEFIAAITQPGINDALDVFPYLIQRCHVNINKRISHLHQALSEFFDEEKNAPSPLLDSALAGYVPLSIKVEFPKSRTDPLSSTPVTTMINKLFYDAFYASKLTVDPRDGLSSRASFSKIFLPSCVILHSLFLEALVNDRDVLNAKRRDLAEKLKRRLAKVCQYITGVKKLIADVRRWFPNGEISYRWVETPYLEESLSLCEDVNAAVWRASQRNDQLTDGHISALYSAFPRIASNWQQRQCVHPFVHAEIRIMLSLAKRTNRDWRPAQRVIGCSKRSCLCCTLWITAYNEHFRTKWMTSRSHGKSCADWALPGAARSDKMMDNGWSKANDIMLYDVQRRLRDTLFDIIIPGRRVSDDNGDYDSDEFDDPMWEEAYRVLNKSLHSTK